MIITLENFTKSYGEKQLFAGVNLSMDAGDKVGIVGVNGTGKSTFLKAIAGLVPVDDGTMVTMRGLRIEYLAQDKVFDPEHTVLMEVFRGMTPLMDALRGYELALAEAAKDPDSPAIQKRIMQYAEKIDELDGWQVESTAKTVLQKLGIGDYTAKAGTLSGGQQKRLALATALIQPCDLLLLDEPTNHLDNAMLSWLEDYLKNYNGAVLLISHDRAFLDNVTTRTVEISLGKAYDYKVPYSRYVVLRAERRAQQMAAYENQQRMIEKTEEFIEKFRYKPTKSNQVQSRIKQLDRLERIEVEEEDLATLNIKFPPAPRSGQIVAEIKEAGMSFGSKHVFSGANFTIERGDKIALVGRNGEGKTTLARMIVGQLTPTEGSIRVGANVNIGYYAQNQEDLMNGDFTVYDTLDRVAVGDVRTRLRDILGAFLFRGEDIDKKVKVLSGGERARLAMARLMLEPYNLLILDEPTNHMDMRSKDILKNAIMKYDGTVIVVSHDREFLDGMVSKVYEFRNGGVREYLGGIYYFLEKRKLESLQEVERKDAPAKEAAPKASSSGKLTYEQKKEQEKLLRKLRKAVETIEASLADLEKKIADYDRKFAEATQYNEADYKAYNELKAEYDHQMHEWEKASYELEITEGE